jgi:ATP phosphoribosyltransferase
MNDQMKIRLALPKGRMFDNVARLMADSGCEIIGNGRNYRPVCSDDRFELKILKPQNIVSMVEMGSHDLAFAGYDWLVELNADVVELLDTRMDPVTVVSAAPQVVADEEGWPTKKIVVASEYEAITREYLNKKGWEYIFVRSYGATEVFPPEDAQLIVDNTATGRTLKDNQLSIVDEILTSSTRLIANKEAYSGEKKELIDELAMLMKSVLDARRRVMLEMNVAQERLNDLISVLPCMRRPTVSTLSRESGFAVKAAVPKKDVPRLLPVLKKAGATDILEYPFSRVVL